MSLENQSWADQYAAELLLVSLLIGWLLSSRVRSVRPRLVATVRIICR
jgi:hypothetical protein